jgi:hypothetical protein
MTTLIFLPAPSAFINLFFKSRDDQYAINEHYIKSNNAVILRLLKAYEMVPGVRRIQFLAKVQPK